MFLSVFSFGIWQVRVFLQRIRNDQEYVCLLQNNPDAHDSFLKINRAYEVLKDEDLRKKYDKYGEKGLDDSQQGGRYESWHFYRYDFGKMPTYNHL